MSLNGIIKKVLSLKEFREASPVLVDIGASEAIHKLWKKISKYSTCIAFDADDREIGYIEKISSDFKKLYVFNCIVSDKDSPKISFFLTNSPYCSSTLEPNLNELENWAYSDKFNVTKNIEIKAKTLFSSLEELNINRIDWFKSDSQGIDLRLFNSLPLEINKKIIVAEFEPGFINSYKGEDKLSDLIKDFESKEFWLSNAKVKGSQRITKNQLDKYFNSEISKKLGQFSHKTSPGWAELIYLNNFNKNNFSIREYLLGWIFSTILNQHGFALLLTEKLSSEYQENYAKLVDEMKSYSIKRIKKNILTLKFLPFVFIKIRQLIGLQ